MGGKLENVGDKWIKQIYFFDIIGIICDGDVIRIFIWVGDMKKYFNNKFSITNVFYCISYIKHIYVNEIIVFWSLSGFRS